MQSNRNTYSGFQRSRRPRQPYVRRPFRVDSKYKRNHEIRSKEVRLVDSKGENHGVVSLESAMSMASEVGMDLIEVSPNAEPRVCKIMSWSKFIYEQKKKEKDARKNKQKEMKEFRFGANIGEGDRERLLRRVCEFLDKGHNVKITVVQKGRVTTQQAKDLLNDLLTRLSGYSSIDRYPSVERRRVSIIMKGLTEKEVQKRKKDAKSKDTKDSSKEVQDVKSPGRKGEEDSVQQEQTGTSSDKENGKKEKQDTK